MIDRVRIVFALYPDMTQLDFTGPHEVFSAMPGAEVIVATTKGGEVASDTGLVFAHTRRLAEIATCDVLCVPGGVGTRHAMQDKMLLAELRRLGEGARYVTSVCSGSLILGAAGLLKGRRAACHWAWRNVLPWFGAIPDAGRVVRDGKLITGGGVTAGIDFALTVVAELAGEETAQAIQLITEYAPAPPFDSGRPESAPAVVLEQVRARFAAMLPERIAAVQSSGGKAPALV
jgi:transcriptional regulator GlxA family with amidase domain